MKSMWIADRLARKHLARETDAYLDRLAEGSVLASQQTAAELLAHLKAKDGPTVVLGKTTWGESVEVPLTELIQACGLVTGGTGAGKSMFAALLIEAMLSQLPQSLDFAFGVLDAKGELFERAVYLLAQRLAELDEKKQEALRKRVVIVDFSGRQAVSPYNILFQWPDVETDYFLTSRLETLRELLPAGEKLSLRGAGLLKHALALLSEQNLPITYLEPVLSDDELRWRLIQKCQSETVRAYFQRHFLQEAKQTIGALRARMDAMFASEGVRLSLSGSHAPDFRRMQDEGKIILVNCAGPTITRGVRLLLQGLVLSDIRQGVFARPNNPFVSYLWLADEAQNFFITRQQEENIADVLTMARSFGSFFLFLCQNISTAVPDARILETLHTNIRWSMTFRSTPRDAGFLRGALPVTGQRKRLELNPFREASVFSAEEERTLALNGVAHLPDRVGYLWLKTYSGEALKIETPTLQLPEGQRFRAVVDSLRRNPQIGGRISRSDYERIIAERNVEWKSSSASPNDLREQMEDAYREQEEQA
ncbi:MAG: hypothetical protein L0338_19260 [Acidobacteria bacterium]|nr:hypothetical protein [Acidobacteriota bacterium]